MHADNIAAHPKAALAGVFDVHRPPAEAAATAHGATPFATAQAASQSGQTTPVPVAAHPSPHGGLPGALLTAAHAHCVATPTFTSSTRPD